MIEVGVGVLVRGDRFFVVRRPPGKIREGWWEFPGGKVEPGETVQACIEREYGEEFGVRIVAVAPLVRWTWTYEEATYRLNAWLCELRHGSPQPEALEGHVLDWVTHRELLHEPWKPWCPSAWPLIAKLLWLKLP